ncbi:hypothetical protein CYY_003597 [Polysphondylium violaceum]|uniref:Uncharacterized protein n=1 Tax=Polysphondylium violaceum TaxID=133409 RepID=A0A8J4V5T0_9MYCE|nr:hypothetical protein CYY_003597 [Polysphondylium violaceum]
MNNNNNNNKSYKNHQHGSHCGDKCWTDDELYKLHCAIGLYGSLLNKDRCEELVRLGIIHKPLNDVYYKAQQLLKQHNKLTPTSPVLKESFHKHLENNELKDITRRGREMELSDDHTRDMSPIYWANN